MSDRECIWFEDLLIRSDIEELAESEWRELEVHIGGCSNCSAFQSTLGKIKSTAEYIGDSDPHPEILKSLQGRMISSKTADDTNLPRPWGYIWAVMRRPVPIYQPLLAAAAALILAFLIQSIPVNGPFVPGKESTAIFSIDPVLEQLEFSESRRIGRTLGEDGVTLLPVPEVQDALGPG